MKTIFKIGLFAFLALVLAGCGEITTIQYEGEERGVSEVEEIIADQLEVENPHLDIEVNIYEETE